MYASYARLSSITEMDVVLAQQAQREVCTQPVNIYERNLLFSLKLVE